MVRKKKEIPCIGTLLGNIVIMVPPLYDKYVKVAEVPFMLRFHVLKMHDFSLPIPRKSDIKAVYLDTWGREVKIRGLIRGSLSARPGVQPAYLPAAVTYPRRSGEHFK